MDFTVVVQRLNEMFYANFAEFDPFFMEDPGGFQINSNGDATTIVYCGIVIYQCSLDDDIEFEDDNEAITHFQSAAIKLTQCLLRCVQCK